MYFYSYQGSYPLGKEPLGIMTVRRGIWEDLKTYGGALRRARRLWGNDFRLYTLTSFYDDTTFKIVPGSPGEKGR